MKIQPIQQPDEDACGPTCIEMVTKYFDLPYTSEDIAQITRYKEEEGMSNIQLVSALETIGFQTEAKPNSTWEDLSMLQSTDSIIIVSWMLDGYIGHFSVVDSVDAEFIYLADPHIGAIRKMEKIQFMRLWLDYDELWYPEKNTDIQLRWMVIVTKK